MPAIERGKEIERDVEEGEEKQCECECECECAQPPEVTRRILRSKLERIDRRDMENRWETLLRIIEQRTAKYDEKTN